MTNGLLELSDFSGELCLTEAAEGESMLLLDIRCRGGTFLGLRAFGEVSGADSPILALEQLAMKFTRPEDVAAFMQDEYERLNRFVSATSVIYPWSHVELRLPVLDARDSRVLSIGSHSPYDSKYFFESKTSIQDGLYVFRIKIEYVVPTEEIPLPEVQALLTKAIKKSRAARESSG